MTEICRSDSPSASNWASIAALGVIWGGTFMVVSIALEGNGPLTVAAARTTLGALALLGLMVALGRPLPTHAAWPYILIIGALNSALPFSLLSWGQQYVPSAFAGISMAALPLFVLPLAHVFSDEKMDRRRVIGVTVGFLGAITLVGPNLGAALQMGTSQGWEVLAPLACLAATISYAVSSVMTRTCPAVDPISLAGTTLAVGAVLILPAMLIVEGLPQWQGLRSGGAIIVLGLFPTALAALLRVSVIRSAGAVFMTLVNYQVPLWSVFFGWLILSEDLPLRFFVALALILCGVAISQWKTVIRILGPRA